MVVNRAVPAARDGPAHGMSGRPRQPVAPVQMAFTVALLTSVPGFWFPWFLPMSIALTDAAARRVQEFLARRPDAVGLRFGVRRTGCSGWAYDVDLAESVAADDHVFESRGLKVVVDAKSLPVVDGTEIDFARKGLNAEFVFRNPKASAECGCGESFTVE